MLIGMVTRQSQAALLDDFSTIDSNSDSLVTQQLIQPQGNDSLEDTDFSKLIVSTQEAPTAQNLALRTQLYFQKIDRHFLQFYLPVGTHSYRQLGSLI